MRSARAAGVCLGSRGSKHSEKCPGQPGRAPLSYPEILPGGYILSNPVTPGPCAHSWVLYEEPEFRGRKLVLPEGEVELRAEGPAWSTQSIGSLRRVVRVSGLGLGVRLPCLPGPSAGRRELESLGQRLQRVLGRGRRGFIMDSPVDSRPWSQLGSASWLGRQGQAEASPGLGKRPEGV